MNSSTPTNTRVRRRGGTTPQQHHHEEPQQRIIAYNDGDDESQDNKAGKAATTTQLSQQQRRRNLLLLFGMICCFILLLPVRRRRIQQRRRSGAPPPPRRIMYTLDAAPDYYLRAPPNTTTLLLKKHKHKTRHIRYPMVEPDYFDYLATSREFKSRPDPQSTKQCEPQYAWQTAVYPTCNTLHEMDLSRLTFAGKRRSARVKLIANGYWRDVWVVPDEAGVKRVVKTLRFEHDLTLRNYDRNRRDAMALERLTSSKYVVGIYGYCSASGLFEFSDGGDIDAAIWDKEGKSRELTSLRKLEIATQAARGLAAMHNVDQEGRASIAHTDIGSSQFIQIDGVYKLNDFNRARFLSKDRFNSSLNCPFHVGRNPGKNRSPEEYKYEPETEKVDVYSFGNILYLLLMEEYPFDGVKSNDAKHQVKHGKRPAIYMDVWNSTDPVIQAMKKAMIWCHEQEPTKRISARAVETYLDKQLQTHSV